MKTERQSLTEEQAEKKACDSLLTLRAKLAAASILPDGSPAELLATAKAMKFLRDNRSQVLAGLNHMGPADVPEQVVEIARKAFGDYCRSHFNQHEPDPNRAAMEAAISAVFWRMGGCDG